MLLDPARVEPFERVHEDAVDDHREVQVIPAREAGGSGLAERVASGHGFALRDRDLGQVPVQAEEPQPVIQNDGVAVDSERLGKDHHAVVRGQDRRVGGRG